MTCQVAPRDTLASCDSAISTRLTWATRNQMSGVVRAYLVVKLVKCLEILLFLECSLLTWCDLLQCAVVRVPLLALQARQVCS